MTRIKLCGMRRCEDIEIVNSLKPNYVGFILSSGYKRSISFKEASELKQLLSDDIESVGVFVNEEIFNIKRFLDAKIIDTVQLHGTEDDSYIEELRKVFDGTIIKAFTIKTEDDIEAARNSIADYVLLDSGKGSGIGFNHSIIKEMNREYFLAGGLTAQNVSDAINTLHPFSVDASSSLESDGFKDELKMTEFVRNVRKVNGNG